MRMSPRLQWDWEAAGPRRMQEGPTGAHHKQARPAAGDVRTLFSKAKGLSGYWSLGCRAGALESGQGGGAPAREACKKGSLSGTCQTAAPVSLHPARSCRLRTLAKKGRHTIIIFFFPQLHILPQTHSFKKKKKRAIS